MSAHPAPLLLRGCGVSTYRGDLRVPTCVMEAAAWHETVRIRCACSHKALHDPHGLWWLCQRRGWSDAFIELNPRFYCTRCLASQGRKIRPASIDTCTKEPTIYLPMPPDRVWKQVIRRFRG